MRLLWKRAAALFFVFVGLATLSTPACAFDLVVSDADDDTAYAYRMPDTPAPLRGSIGSFASGTDAPNGIEFGPEGDLYILSASRREVSRFNFVTGAKVGTTAVGSLNTPVDLLFTRDGTLLVLTSRQVRRYNAATDTFTDLLATANQPLNAIDFELGPDGLLYVADAGSANNLINRNIKVYSPVTGAIVRVGVAAGTGGLVTPAGLTFGPDGLLYVSDYENDRVLRFDPATGVSRGQFNSGETTGVALDGPLRLRFGPEGDLYVISDFRNTVLLYNGPFVSNPGKFAEVKLSPGVGTNIMGRPRYLTFSPWSGPKAFDVDRDGRADLVLQNTDQRLAFWRMNGETVLAGLTSNNVIPAGWQVCANGDFDGDGVSDLALQNLATRKVSLWLMNGTNLRYGVALNEDLPTGWRIVGSGEFTGDNKQDLILQHTDGRVMCWTLLGHRKVLSTVLNEALPVGWSVVGAGGFNADSYSDLALQHTDGRVAFWLMLRTQVVTGVLSNERLPTGWTVAAAADLNRDGYTDLVLQNTDRRVAYWQVYNARIITGRIVSESLGTGWNIVGPK